MSHRRKRIGQIRDIFRRQEELRKIIHLAGVLLDQYGATEDNIFPGTYWRKQINDLAGFTVYMEMDMSNSEKGLSLYFGSEVPLWTAPIFGRPSNRTLVLHVVSSQGRFEPDDILVKEYAFDVDWKKAFLLLRKRADKDLAAKRRKASSDRIARERKDLYALTSDQLDERTERLGL